MSADLVMSGVQFSDIGEDEQIVFFISRRSGYRVKMCGRQLPLVQLLSHTVPSNMTSSPAA